MSPGVGYQPRQCVETIKKKKKKKIIKWLTLRLRYLGSVWFRVSRLAQSIWPGSGPHGEQVLPLLELEAVESVHYSELLPSSHSVVTSAIGLGREMLMYVRPRRASPCSRSPWCVRGGDTQACGCDAYEASRVPEGIVCQRR